ncbi:MAG: serine/threonine-protein kinase [Acidobacteria bacterium]|nr:serine/threonine-protein kinase [Acidobacteriota bacterium]
MGVVWKAADTSLDRDVAIKFLPPAFSADADRLQRFEREAKLLASLNHRGIAAIYGLHSDAGQRFLAMELVEGEDLSARILGGPVPIEEALGIAVEVAEALEAAHENGVIHRDLKPANIRLTPSGRVKILDFGLAKFVLPDPGSGSSDASRSPTMTSGGTAAGIIMGTAAYMSPEQAKGKPVDRRADVWSFGVVLFELLTGRQPFRSDSVTETLASVIMKQPDLGALPAGTPQGVRRIIERCLRKDPNTRLRDIGEARIEIQEILAGRSSAEIGAPALEGTAVSRPRPTGLLAAALVTGALLGVAGAWIAMRPAPPRAARAIRMDMALPADAPLAAGSFLCPMALSPDGSQLVYVGVHEGVRRLYIRDLGGFEAAPLSGTEGAEGPFFSPDGQWIGFCADSKLKKVSVHGGGLPQTLAPLLDFRGAAWGPDDTIVLAPAQLAPLSTVSASGGALVPLTKLDEANGEWSHRFPHFLPDGKTIVYSAHRGAFNFDEAAIWAYSIASGKSTKILDGSSDPRVLSSGQLVYVQAGSLLAAPFDAKTLKILGAARTLVEGIAVQANTGAAFFTVSASGTLAYLPGGVVGGKTDLVWMDAAGHAEEFTQAPIIMRYPRLSPDGQQVLTTGIGSNRSGVWFTSTREAGLKRLASDNGAPVWSPDGKRYLSDADTRAATRLVWSSPDGGGGQTLVESEKTWVPTSISPDGRWLAFTEHGADHNADIWVMPIDGKTTPTPWLKTPALEGGARFSPDGRYITYVSDESGRFEVYVADFPGPGGKRQISLDGGREAIWPSHGAGIFFRSGQNFMAASAKTSPSFEAGSPRVLFRTGYEGLLSNVDFPNFDATADGSRFMMMRNEELDARAPNIRVVLNWFADLQGK